MSENSPEKNLVSGQVGCAWYMAYTVNKSDPLNLYCHCVFYREQKGYNNKIVRDRWKGGAEGKRERRGKDIKSEGKAVRNNSKRQINRKSTENS